MTRRTQRDRVIGVQRILADLGYLDPQDFDGTLGTATAKAIKAFQKANNMPESGAFTDDLVKKVYEVAGKGEPPVGHIFVRQEFSRVFDAPVGLTNPDEPLGTHVYTAMKFAPGDTKARWMAVTVQGGSPEEALDRIQIPDDIRQRISERLTPGIDLDHRRHQHQRGDPSQGRRFHGACQVQLAQDGRNADQRWRRSAGETEADAQHPALRLQLQLWLQCAAAQLSLGLALVAYS